jgi:hypothetical protein
MANQFSRSQITFNGLKAVLSGSFTVGPGVTPSRCTIYIAPQAEPIPVVGTLQIYDDTGGVIFPDCRAQSLSVEIGTPSLTVWAVTLMDTRWRWAYGEISGEYNVRDARDRIIPAQVRTPQQLAKLLFKAMGVAQADVSKMPNTLFPEKRWDTANPARELQTLLEETGCLVTLGSANLVQVWPIGAGGFLPDDNTLIDNQILYELPDLPDALCFRGGRDQYQLPLRCVPVAEDEDGTIKNFDEVSYTPFFGALFPALIKHRWGLFDLEFANAVFPEETDPLKLQKKAVARNLAAKWIFRAYRISLGFDGEQPVEAEFLDENGNKKREVVKDIDRLLPLNNTRLLRTSPIPFDPLKLPDSTGPAPVVYGRWQMKDSTIAGTNLDVLRSPRPTADQESREAKNLDARPFPTGKIDDPKNRFEIYNGGWSLDAERGIVFFSEPVYQVLEVDLSGGDAERNDLLTQHVKVPAIIYLLVSFGVRHSTTRAWVHREIVRKLPGAKYGTKPKYVYRTETAFQTWKNQYVDNLISTNSNEFDRDANRYLDHEQKRLIGDKPASATYAGFKKLYLDGAIRQVTWFIDDAGYARTRASRNRDEPNVAETYQQKQLYEELAQLVSRNAKEASKEREKYA